MQIERPLQKHGGRLKQNETYCGSCYGAVSADFMFWIFVLEFEQCLVAFSSSLREI